MFYSDIVRRVVERRRDTGVSECVIGTDLLKEILRCAALTVEVDEEWYVKANEDVRLSIESGALSRARDHYAKYGFMEGRLPRPIRVDAEFYLSRYPDVRRAIESGTVSTADEHFSTQGRFEGRIPYLGFSILPVEVQL